MLIPEAFVRDSTRRAALVVEALAPALRLAASATCGRAKAPAEWRHGILIGSNHMGDVLCRTGSLAALAEALPDCSWDFLAHGAGAEVLAGNPHVGIVEGSNLLTRSSVRKVAEGSYDVALCYDAVSYYRALTLAAAAGIPARIAFVHKGMSGLVTFPVAIRFPGSFAEYFRDMVQALGGKGEWSLRPQVFPSRQEEIEAEEVWTALGFEEGVPVLACMPFTRQTVGVWESENYGRVLAMLHRSRLKVQSVLVGSPAEVDKMRSLAGQFELPSRILDKKLNLRALAVFLGRCAMAFGADSGPRHLANAAGIRVAFVRNTSVLPTETGIYLPESETDLVPPAQRSLSGPHLDPAEVANRLVEMI